MSANKCETAPVHQNVFTRTMIQTLLLFSVFLLLLPAGFAQTTTATLTGTAEDTDKAVIPNAKVVLVNRATKYVRNATANGAGVFVFAGIDTGDYSLTITYPGFEKFTLNAVHLDPGDTRDIDDIRMVPGNVDVTVNVDASQQNVVQDTGERSSIITSKDLDKLSLEGREVTELLKIIPGSAISTGSGANQNGVSNTAFDPGQVGFGGAAGSYSISGSPTNGAAIRSDGANLTDPTSGAGSLQTINAESTSEVKIQTANFGADSANGPLVINAVGKSGSSDYHGSVYAYGRTNQLDSTDSIANVLGISKAPDRYIYPGGSLGGPIKIPFTNLNHSKKLTFFVNGEDYIQRNVYAYNNVSQAVYHALVPTAGMLAGDFSAAQISKYLPAGIPVCDTPHLAPGITCQNLQNLTPSTAAGTYAGAPSDFQAVNSVPVADGFRNPVSCTGAPGDCLAGSGDPGAVAQLSHFPLPNTVNGQTLPIGYNFISQNLVNSDIYEAHGRLDYARSDRTKFYLTNTAENGATTVPQEETYFASGSSGGVDTPGGTKRNTYTDSSSINWTQTFSNTLTNEAFASFSYSDQIDQAAKPESLFNAAIGYPYTGAYANGTKEFPELSDYSRDGLPLALIPDYSFGPLFNKSFVPGFGDNVTKLIRKHTVKFGVNVERPLVNQFNQQISPTNGEISNYYVRATFTLPDPANPNNQVIHSSTCYNGGDLFCTREGYSGGNGLANYYVGDFSNYSEANLIPHYKMHAWTTSFYGTDDWKVTRNLSVTFGLRIDHIGRWIDNFGQGASVFNPTEYATDSITSGTIPLPGFRWHSIDDTVKISGFKTREFFFQPRTGMRWDVYGNGKTTLSGGFGFYRFRDGQADATNAISASAGLRGVAITNTTTNTGVNGAQNTGAGLTMAYIQSLHINPSPTSAQSVFLPSNGYDTASGSTFYGVDPTDDEAPLTTNYSATVTQQLPMNLEFSIGYVGNQSSHLLNDNNNSENLANINAIPVGGLFQPNPNPGSTAYGTTFTPSTLYSGNNYIFNDYRKYPRYTDLQVERHVLNANYNALQLVLNHTKGALFFGVNYTFSKNLGVKGGYQNGNAGDSFNARNDYGPLSYDRSQIFNASYNYDFGSKYHGSAILKPVLNGWQVSGITNLQSGANLQATNYTTDFGLNGYIQDLATDTTYSLSNITNLGTPDVSLQPTLTCNPTYHLAKRQYMNGNCFALPPQGGYNGPFNYPYIHGPAYFQSDLTLVKDVRFKEKQQFEFRAAAFDFLNYKLKTFSNVAPAQLALTYPLNEDPLFGKSVYNTGRRVMELSLKYTF